MAQVDDSSTEPNMTRDSNDMPRLSKHVSFFHDEQLFDEDPLPRTASFASNDEHSSSLPPDTNSKLSDRVLTTIIDDQFDNDSDDPDHPNY